MHERETLEVLRAVDDRVVEHWGTELARTLTPPASPGARLAVARTAQTVGNVAKMSP